MSRMALQHRVKPLLMSAVLLLNCGTAGAGDEEMMNPYQTFDPETGFFVDESVREHETNADDEDPRNEHGQSGISAWNVV